LFYDGGRNWRVSVLQLTGEESFMAGVAKLTVSTLSESNVWGKKSWEKDKKKTDFENLDSFWDTLNHLGKIYNVRHAWTLKEISETREGVHLGDNNGRMLHK